MFVCKTPAYYHLLYNSSYWNHSSLVANKTFRIKKFLIPDRLNNVKYVCLKKTFRIGTYLKFEAKFHGHYKKSVTFGWGCDWIQNVSFQANIWKTFPGPRSDPNICCIYSQLGICIDYTPYLSALDFCNSLVWNIKFDELDS